MPTFGPINRKELVRCLKQVGFEGPYSGGRHQFMVKGTLTIRIPNHHQADIGRELLTRMLRQVSIGKAEWEKL